MQMYDLFFALFVPHTMDSEVTVKLSGRWGESWIRCRHFPVKWWTCRDDIPL